MEALKRAARMEHIHSDIRGPLYLKALEMQKNGEKVLKLNTGNPAVFGFELPDSIRKAMEESADKGMAYCDFRECRRQEKPFANTSAEKASGELPWTMYL